MDKNNKALLDRISYHLSIYEKHEEYFVSSILRDFMTEVFHAEFGQKIMISTGPRNLYVQQYWNATPTKVDYISFEHERNLIRVLINGKIRQKNVEMISFLEELGLYVEACIEYASL